MARTDGPTNDHDPGTAGLRRRKAVRLLVPVGVAGVAAATIGLVPALASSGGGGGHPDLPKTTAEQLLTKLAKSDVQTVSGTVRVNTDLGLPGFLGGGRAASGLFGGGEDQGHQGGDGENKGSTADPQSRLSELAVGSHTLRVAADGPQRQRVSVVEDAAEYSVIHNGKDVWAYDSASNQVVHNTADHQADHRAHHRARPEGLPATPDDFARQALKALDPSTSVTVDGTTTVAGQDAYRLLLTPKGSTSTVGSIAIAVDADNGAPLKFTLTPKGGGKAAVDVGFTSVSFAKPDAKNFRFTPPKGAKVTEGKHAPAAKRPGNPMDGFTVTGKGWNSVVQLKLPGGLPGGNAFKDHGDAPKGFDPMSLLKHLGDRVNGQFGSGTVIHSRLVNVLITDNGKVYAGAVTKDALVAAANK
jgi:outer membrane lipoprotein-sorting protein